MNRKITISLCGDILVAHSIPHCLELDGIAKILHSYDFNFGNLETTVCNNEGTQAAFPGGCWTKAHPTRLDELKALGFNMLNTANNHSMDYGEGGLLATLKHLDDRGIPHAGTGKDLQAAAAPAYINKNGVRIALVGVTSSFHDSYLAGPHGTSIIGRPGVAPLRHKSIYELPSEEFKALENIVKRTGINSYYAQAIKEGYLPMSENLKIGFYEFVRGKKFNASTIPNKSDMERTLNSIRSASYYADFIVVSVHGHQFMSNGTKEDVPQFLRTFSHHCIDGGANIVVCHGPHLVRGIEKYKDGVIFHGLGNFIQQHDMPTEVPAEAYLASNINDFSNISVGELMMDIKSNYGRCGLVTDAKCWQGIIAGVTFENVKFDINLYPIELMLNETKGLRGFPRISKDMTVIKRIADLSGRYGTKIELSKDNIGIVIQS